MNENISPAIRAQSSWILFALGYFFLVSVPWIFPAFSDMIGDSTLGIVEVTVLILDVLFIILLPIGKAAMSFYNDKEVRDPIKETSISIIILIFGILITYFGYFMVTNNAGEGGMVSLVEGTFEIALFWIGLIGTWAMTVIVGPITNIIKHTRN